MLKVIFATMLAVSGFSAFAKESMTEKANAKAHDAKRAVKKGGHRMAEAVCAQDDVKCLEEKAKNRVEEGKDYMKDKGQETKDKVDADGKAGG